MYTYEIYQETEINDYLHDATGEEYWVGTQSNMVSFYSKEKVDIQSISSRFLYFKDLIRCLIWEYGFVPNYTFKHRGEVIKFKFNKKEF